MNSKANIAFTLFLMGIIRSLTMYNDRAGVMQTRPVVERCYCRGVAAGKLH